MRFTLPLFILTSTLAVAGCDPAPGDGQSVRERIGNELGDVEITLAEAIAIAEGAAPGGVVLEAELDVHDKATTYNIELLEGNAEREIDVSPQDGSIVRDRLRALDGDDLAEAEAAAALVSASVGWAEILARAESEVGGVAFEVEADDDGVLEVELLVGDEIWETEHAADGSLTKSEKSDDQRDDDAGEVDDDANEGPDDDDN